MTEKRKLSRRKFLGLATVTGAGAIVTACSKAAPSPEPTTAPVADTSVPATSAPEPTPVPPTSAPQPTAAPTSEFSEAPMLAHMVTGGTLPSIDQRLPKIPKLTNEMDEQSLRYEIGEYGGTLRLTTSVPGWDADIFIMCNEPLLNTPGIKGEEVTPNILQDYTVSDDQKVFSFTMREGLKWSDGAPVTAEDIRFAWEDVLMNQELTTEFPDWLSSGGVVENGPMTLDIGGDYAFTLTSSVPYAGLPLSVAIKGWRGYTTLLKPAHHLKKYHRAYADEDELQKMIDEAKLENWAQLYDSHDFSNWSASDANSIGFPRLTPWVLKEASQQVYVHERNPYYFKVDSAGNQLPYIDKLESYIVPDVEVVALKHISGEVDFARESASLVKMPLYKENEAKSGFKAYMCNMHVTPTDIFLNLTYDDPVWRQVVRDVRFRKAMAHAIDQKEVIDTVYYGFAEESTLMPSYDPDEANRLLDDMGMDKRDADGFRLGPDGKTFVVPFEIGAWVPDEVPLVELVVQMWQAVGIKTTMKVIAQELAGERSDANEIQADVGSIHTPLWFMADWAEGRWGNLWEKWRLSQGKEGEEPPDDVEEFYRVIASISSGTIEEGRAAYEKASQMLKENLYFLVHIQNVKQPLIANAKLGNIADGGFAIAWDFSGEQFFYKS